ncbi:MAG: hypothetical protein QF567_02080 [Candidatus Pacearchaeota archaeon]|jgi:hypothetical protein|nr:hypothetical protein [Candidatus Pacearchaeota archaeon]MDP7520999.1 hypothetical protein [Candidatus Pacearchaeota archaeon]|tara:strand:+ start:1165 stop:2283 length:1119 start_codon:yes stop_codon:yes gene_type:complete
MVKKKFDYLSKKVESKIKKDSQKIFLGLLIILSIIFIINIIIISSSSSALGDKIAEIKELNKPVKIELNTIECNDCFNVSGIVEGIKNQNVEILNENTYNKDSNEAKELIKKYNINKLPSILISGEINSEKIEFNNFELINDALVLNKINAPYLDLITDEIKGKVEIIEIIDSTCEKCISLSSIPLNFVESGVSIDDWRKVEYNSAEGNEFINKFEIKHSPALLISNDINYYENIKQGLDQSYLEEKQGFYVLPSTIPPYRNLTDNKIVGLSDLIMLVDESCSSCYNVEINKQILQGLGVVINNEDTYDINSAKGNELILKYDIKKVPMIILSKETSVYDSFVSVWSQVGTIEDDGMFVMRKPEGLGNTQSL